MTTKESIFFNKPSTEETASPETSGDNLELTQEQQQAFETVLETAGFNIGDEVFIPVGPYRIGQRELVLGARGKITKVTTKKVAGRLMPAVECNENKNQHLIIADINTLVEYNTRDYILHVLEEVKDEKKWQGQENEVDKTRVSLLQEHDSFGSPFSRNTIEEIPGFRVRGDTRLGLTDPVVLRSCLMLDKNLHELNVDQLTNLKNNLTHIIAYIAQCIRDLSREPDPARVDNSILKQVQEKRISNISQAHSLKEQFEAWLTKRVQPALDDISAKH